MEDESPPKDSHLWTLSDFIERRKDWDQRDEARLAEYLQQLSNKITQGAKSTLNELNEVVASVDDTAVQVANINNKFQLLADKQFIENKVQEEDETVQINDEKPVAHKINNADTLVNNYKEALKFSFKAIDTHFEKVTVIVSDSDDDDDDEELKHKETILRPRTLYKKLNLPSLSGDTQPEIIVDATMSVESDSDIEQPTNTFKDEESFSSNDAPEENINFISESRNLHEPNIQPTDIYSNIAEPEKVKPTQVSSFVGNIEADDLFSPPPLINDNDEDDLENEYNMFGNNNSNMYNERNLWDDEDDDDFSNEPLPIYSDEPPLSLYSDQPPLPVFSDQPSQLVIDSNPQEKVEVPSIQQSLNDELRKRFQKDNTSSSPDTPNIESSKPKVPKGAVNILGGIDTKPYVHIPPQNLRQEAISQVNNTAQITQITNNDNNARKDLNVSNKLFDHFIINTPGELKKEINPIKKKTLFEQDSEDEDLFAVPSSKIENTKKKENTTNSEKLSKTMFLESDSDEEFFNTKSNVNTIFSHTNIDQSSTKLLDSSSDDDDIFNRKLPKQKSALSFSQVLEESKNTNIEKKEKKQEPKSSMVQTSAEKVINKDVMNELKNRLEDTCTIDDRVMESPKFDKKIDQSNKKSTGSRHLTKSSNLFSSDEDEFNDDEFLNITNSDKNNEKLIDKEKNSSNPSNLAINTNIDLNVSKVSLFDSSSDDDIFKTDKSSNLKSSEKSTHSNSKEIQNIEAKQNNNQDFLNPIKKTENIEVINNSNSIGKSVVDKKMENVFSLSDDDENDNFLSFDNTSDGSVNLPNCQNINNSEKCINLKIDLRSKDNVQNVMDDTNKIISKNKEDTLKDQNKSFLFPSGKDEKQLSLNSNNQNLVSEEQINVNYPTSVSTPKCVIKKENLKSFIDKEEIDVLKKETTPILKNNSVLNNDDKSETEDSEVINQTLDSIKISNENKDSVDGSSFSSQKETPKKLPGKLNKNAGAFINIKGLLPNSKSRLMKLDVSRSGTLDENNKDNLPSSGAKLFSAEKERAKIQVKRRPQSRKARQVAARMSSIDIGEEPKSLGSSRLYGSSSDLVDYQSSSVLDDDITNPLDKVQNKTQTSSNAPFVTIEKNSEQADLNFKSKNNILDLLNDDSSSFDSSLEETGKNIKKLSLNDKQSELVVDKNFSKIKSMDKKHQIIEPVIDKHPDIALSKETIPNIETEKQSSTTNTKEFEENKANCITESTLILSKKLNSLFDNDSDSSESSLEETSKNEEKGKLLEHKQSEQQIIESSDRQSDIASIKETISNVLTEKQSSISNSKEFEENKAKSVTQNTSMLSNKLNSLFDDDSDTFESFLEETDKNENKGKLSSNKKSEQHIIEPVSDKQLDIVSIEKTILNVESEKQSFISNIKEFEKNEAKSLTVNTPMLSGKVNSLFDEDSDSFESSLEESDKNEKKGKSLDDKKSKQQIFDKKHIKNESIVKQQPIIKPVNVEQLDIESVHETNLKIETEKQSSVSNTEELKKNKLKSVIQSTSILSKKSNSLFDVDDDDDLFFSKLKKKTNLPSSSNIFDSDDELEFTQKFTKTNLSKTKSIFGDDSDDDLFNTPSKSSKNNLSSQKPIDKSSQQQNRYVADGYVKLTAESVAINPLESKKN